MVEANFNQDIKTKPNSSVCSVNISGLDTKIPSTSLELRRKVICLIREVLSTVQSFYHEDVVELNFIQSGSLLIEFYEWRRKNTQELMQALCSGHLDPEDLALVSEFMSGHISGDVVFPPNGSFNPSLPPQLTLEHDSEDDDDERRLDENSLLKCAMEEVNVFKRVLELKRAGLWSADDSSCGAAGPGNDNPTNISLAPPPEPTCRTFSDYMFAEVNWLAEDFKRERQWKRVSAKKLALTAVKCHRDKSERATKMEKEEAVRVRKTCAFIARMVRDWWRQMDKIVQAKQQVRLTAKRQQAICSHLGQVLETTEEYTRWLTEGITTSKPKRNASSINSTSNSNQKEKISVSENHDLKSYLKQPDVSDEEFVADEKALAEAEDDEETIEQEEKFASEGQQISKISPTVELAELEADANCPLEDLLPPGYLDFLQSCSAERQDLLDSELKDHRWPTENSKETSSTQITYFPLTLNKCKLLEETQNEVDISNSENKETDILKLESNTPVEDSIKNTISRDEGKGDSGAFLSAFDIGSNSQSLSVGENEITDSETDEEYSDANEFSSVKSNSESSLIELVELETNNNTSETEHETNKIPANSNSVEAQQSYQTFAGGENIESVTNEALTTSSEVGLTTISPPFLLSGGTLREYQLVGLSWLVAIYDKRLNGILADEMGLGKTIQTISLLAYLACERGVWGPHLIVVPTSVILNWEVEFKRWCPAFKILTYFGSMKERKHKRKGWTKTNAFHVCITSYRLAIQDATAFKRKKWKYLILDEAQNIKNFKSQRWQTLLTFNSQRRLLLTGTPLQNSLMELWSLMHFLMPNIFQSHRDFQEWFASPITGMIEGNTDHNDLLVQRLHKVLRPFLLRRLKADVERQLPKKFEHVIMCRLSRRQRFLYDDFMSLGSTQETLKSGQFLSVMNILMQLRKVCNHPNLFETRPIISPFRVPNSYVTYSLPRLILSMSHPFLVFAPSSNGGRSIIGSASAFTEPDLDWLDPAGSVARLLGQTMNLAEMARDLSGFVARRCYQLCARENLITVIDSNDVIDDVTSQRIQFNALKKSHKTFDEYSGQKPFFDSKYMTADYTDGYYPALSPPATIEPTIVKADLPKNPWNIGMPKSCLRLRFAERQNRLLLMSRVNERRCNITFNSHSNDIGMDWDHGTHIGPDLVLLISRLLHEKSVTYDRRSARTYPGLINGATCCQLSLYTWPVRNCSFTSNESSRVDKASCFEISSQTLDLSTLRSLGPRDAIWSRVPRPLRKMLHSPCDYLNDLREVLKRFVFVVPAVISSGFMLQVSSHALEHQVINQESRIRDMLLISGCLPPACLPENSCEYRRSTNRLPPLSPQIWLMPSKLHQLVMSCRIQFPDPRLIQYDCGKLQRLNGMLRELKSGNHRVLIFTQMARMLDILEQFLAYHGHRYLRLDGTTKVEQRQVLMERFNQDTQIFVFILSTRSGGLGVNLTGADTVIFYDSDWNPTMDAQAQDRCHRIGQTRDVHIYRLISERTVEENILRKANQKRFLSDVAIEGGKFTTAFFKQNTITELFAEPSGLQDLAKIKDLSAAESSSSSQFEKPFTDSGSSVQPDDKVIVTRSGRQIRPTNVSVLAALTPSQDVNHTESVEPALNAEAQLEALLDACEEESDRIAARRALDEAKADLAEFEEKSPNDDNGVDPTNSSHNDGSSIPPVNEIDPLSRLRVSRQRCENQNMEEEHVIGSTSETIEEVVERELIGFESQLKPVERFGVRQVEEQREQMLNEQLDMADAELIESEKVWRLEKLKALHEADEQRAELEDDDMFYCCGKYDPSSQLAELERLERIQMEDVDDTDASLNILDSGQVFSSGRSKYPRKRPYDLCLFTQRITTSQTNSSTKKSSKASSTDKVYKRPKLDMKKRLESNKIVFDDEEAALKANHDGKGSKNKTHPLQTDTVKSQMDTFVEKLHFPPVVPNRKFQNPDAPQSSNHYARPNSTWDKTDVIRQDASPSKIEYTIPHQSYHGRRPPDGGGHYLDSCGSEHARNQSRQSLGYLLSQKRTDSSVIKPNIPDKMLRFDAPNPAISSYHYNPENVVHEEVVEASNSNELSSSQKSSYSLSDMEYNVPIGSSSERIPSSIAGSEPSSVTTGTLCGARSFVPINTTPPILHLRTKYQTPPSIPFRLLSPTAPCIQHPPEPVIPVQSIPDGSHINLTAKQVLVPTGQPVFVITRQMKTPTGEVYQQRFTHPVIPPPQFARMVCRLQKPSDISHASTPYETNRVRQPEPTAESTVACPSSLISNPVPVGIVMKPTSTVTNTQSPSPDSGLRNTITTVKHFTQLPRPSVNGIRCGTSIPVIRMINCDANKTTPIIRLINPEANYINNDMVNQPNPQPAPTLPVPSNAIRVGNAVRLMPNHISSANAQVIKLQRVVSNLTCSKDT